MAPVIRMLPIALATLVGCTAAPAPKLEEPLPGPSWVDRIYGKRIDEARRRELEAQRLEWAASAPTK